MRVIALAARQFVVCLSILVDKWVSVYTGVYCHGGVFDSIDLSLNLAMSGRKFSSCLNIVGESEVKY